MPFDRGRMDDPNPSAFEQFDDWCYDQGFAEGMNEAKMQVALREG